MKAKGVNDIVLKFVNTEIPEYNKNEKNEFKKYMEKKRTTKPKKEQQQQCRHVQYRYRYINIDSRDRDISLYPNQNKYAIDVSKELFTNVQRVEIVGTEFINYTQLIRNSPIPQKNNIIQWNVLNDLIDGNHVIYTAVLNAGNYTDEQLRNEIQAKMNSVTRIGGQLTYFDIGLDTITGEVTFAAVDYEAYANIVSVVAGFPDVEISYPAHGFVVGDRIYVRNSTSVGGVPSYLVNGKHVITAIVDPNTFEYTIDVDAAFTEVSGGGNDVRVGTELETKMLFSSEFGFAESVLGFNGSDTNFSVMHSNASETDGIRLEINKMTSAGLGQTSVRTTLPHGLVTGEIVFLYSIPPAGTTILPYTHEYGTTPLNPVDQDIMDIFMGSLTDPYGLEVVVTGDNTFNIAVEYGNYNTSAGGLLEDYINNTVGPNDAFGNIITFLSDGALDLYKDQYVIMTSDAIGGDMSLSNANFTNAYAKIQIAGDFNDTVFNSWVAGKKVYYTNALDTLSVLDFAFYNNDGSLVAFNDTEHSFTLRVTEMLQKVKGSEYSSKIGTSMYR